MLFDDSFDFHFEGGHEEELDSGYDDRYNMGQAGRNRHHA